MPFNLDIFAWWGWLLCALALRFASWFFASLYESAKYSRYSSTWERAGEWSLATVFLIAAILSAIIGLVGLGKWLWGM